ncbi:hypothetical protein ACM66B_003564 [Microbotryomycetes sp. NB124-2]
MTSTMYLLDLATLEWTIKWQAATSDRPGPRPRYFHSAEVWRDRIVVFGGESYTQGETTEQDPSEEGQLETLADLWVFDTQTATWSHPELDARAGVEAPMPRYAHLATILSFNGDSDTAKSDIMLVIGGQDVRNTYLQSAHVLDLDGMSWIHETTWSRSIGTYRAVAASASSQPTRHKRTLVSNPDESNDRLWVFSNSNFSQVRRELDLVDLRSDKSLQIRPCFSSSPIDDGAYPPGLRFPGGGIIGRHLVVFGTHLSRTSNTFAVWSLSLDEAENAPSNGGASLKWTKIDAGSAFGNGRSWNRAVLWQNSVVVFGNPQRDISKDYDLRRTNFTHVGFVDLEAYGAHQHFATLGRRTTASSAIGANVLLAGAATDFEIRCSDGTRLACSRKILSARWPWFLKRLHDFGTRLSKVQSVNGQSEELDGPSSASDASVRTRQENVLPRSLDLPEPSFVVAMFLRYVYTQRLDATTHRRPEHITGLLAFAKTYEHGPLRKDCTLLLHELNGTLQSSTAQIFEAATLAGCTALQVCALKHLMGGISSGARP